MVFGTGPRVGDALVKHPDVKLISFTGSTPTARIIRAAAAPHTKKLSLEVGKKSDTPPELLPCHYCWRGVYMLVLTQLLGV